MKWPSMNSWKVTIRKGLIIKKSAAVHVSCVVTLYNIDKFLLLKTYYSLSLLLNIIKHYLQINY